MYGPRVIVSACLLFLFTPNLREDGIENNDLDCACNVCSKEWFGAQISAYEHTRDTGSEDNVFVTVSEVVFLDLKAPEVEYGIICGKYLSLVLYIETLGVEYGALLSGCWKEYCVGIVGDLAQLLNRAVEMNVMDGIEVQRIYGTN
ncbi:hypothetical protein C8R42DRAFT_645827 [Lentinula raphanica]|nr:hypothetical protein C8R42DRAFT_645827 [Lentinula raphanica]